MSARLTRRFSVASEPPPAAALHATPPQTWSPARGALRRHVRVELLDDRNGDDRIVGVGENVGLCTASSAPAACRSDCIPASSSSAIFLLSAAPRML